MGSAGDYIPENCATENVSFVAKFEGGGRPGEPVQGPEDVILLELAAFTGPVLRIFDETADGQPNVDFGEYPSHEGLDPAWGMGRNSDVLCAETFCEKIDLSLGLAYL